MRFDKLLGLGLSRFQGMVATLAFIAAVYAGGEMYRWHRWSNGVLVAVALLALLFLEPQYAKYRERVRRRQSAPEPYSLLGK